MQGAERLAQLVAHLHPYAGAVGVVVEPLGAEEGVEMRLEFVRIVGHRRADLNRSTAPRLYWSAIGFLTVPLTDDQRAMIRLLAQREEGYEDIAALMGLSVDEVRARVKEALEELDGPREAPEAPAPAKVAAPAPSKPAPPAPVAKSKRSRPLLPRDRGQRAAILAGIGVVVVLVVLLATGAFGGGSSTSSTTTAAAEVETTSATEATGAENGKLTQAALSSVNGGGSEGRALFGRIKRTPVLQVEAKGLEPSPKGSSYTVWLYKSPQLALRVGAVDVSKSGGIAAQFPIPTELVAYVASGAFDQIDISLTDDAAYKAEVAKAKQEKRLPAYTGEDVLRGKIAGPAVKK